MLALWCHPHACFEFKETFGSLDEAAKQTISWATAQLSSYAPGNSETSIRVLFLARRLLKLCRVSCMENGDPDGRISSSTTTTTTATTITIVQRPTWATSTFEDSASKVDISSVPKPLTMEKEELHQDAHGKAAPSANTAGKKAPSSQYYSKKLMKCSKKTKGKPKKKEVIARFE